MPVSVRASGGECAWSDALRDVAGAGALDALGVHGQVREYGKLKREQQGVSCHASEGATMLCLRDWELEIEAT